MAGGVFLPGLPEFPRDMVAVRVSPMHLFKVAVPIEGMRHYVGQPGQQRLRCGVQVNDQQGTGGKFSHPGELKGQIYASRLLPVFVQLFFSLRMFA